VDLRLHYAQRPDARQPDESGCFREFEQDLVAHASTCRGSIPAAIPDVEMNLDTARYSVRHNGCAIEIALPFLQRNQAG
jgi:hypothetical protein